MSSRTPNGDLRCPNPLCRETPPPSALVPGSVIRCRKCTTGYAVPSTGDHLPAPPQLAAQAAPTPPRETITPKRIGRYRIQGDAPLGVGGFGQVYLAYDPQLKRKVAIKIPKEGTLDGHPRRVQRFLGDARSAAQLQHPNIVPVYDAGVYEGTYYIASAYVQGTTLRTRLEQLGAAYPLQEAVEVVRKLAEALHYAHELSIFHRDVKPDNILLDEEGEPHLIDFGLAAWRTQEADEPDEPIPNAPTTDDVAGEALRTRAGAICGTPGYLSPEAAQGQSSNATQALDQYSLGIVLYELLTGRTPFRGEIHKLILDHIETPPPPPREQRPDLPPDLEAICLKCLEKDPAARYKNCAALAEDLRRWLYDERVSVREPGHVETLRRWWRKERRVALLAGGVAVSLLLGVTVSLWFAWSAGAHAYRADQSAGEAKVRKEQAEAAEAVAQTARGIAEDKSEKEEAARKKAEAAEQRADAARADAVTEKKNAEDKAAEARAAEAKEKVAAKEALDRLHETQREQYFNLIALAERELRDRQTRRARNLLAAAENSKVPLGWEWKYLNREAARPPRIERPVNAMAFRPGETVTDRFADDWFAWANEHTVIVRRRGTNDAEIHSVNVADTTIRCLTFSGDGFVLAVGCADGSVQRWTYKPDGAVRANAPPERVGGRINAGGPVTALAVNKDGSELLIGRSDGQVGSYAGNALKFLPRQHTSEIRSVAFATLGLNPTPTHALSVCKANRVRFTDLKTLQVDTDRAYESFTALVQRGALPPNPTFFYAAKEGGRIVPYKVVDHKAGAIQEVLQYREHSADVIALQASLGVGGKDSEKRGFGDHVASLDEAGILRVWELLPSGTTRDHQTIRAYGSFALNRKGDDVAWVGENDTVHLRIAGRTTTYELKSGKHLKFEGEADLDKLGSYTQYLHAVCYGREGKSLVTVASGPSSKRDGKEMGEVATWGLPDGARLGKPVKDEQHPIWTVDIAPAGGLAWGGKGLDLKLPTGTVRTSASVNLVKFAPNSKVLAAAQTNGRVSRWDTEQGNLLGTELVVGPGQVSALGWSASSDRLYIGDDLGTLAVADERGVKQTITNAHAGRIWALLTLHHEGRDLLLSAGEDGKIKVWDPNDLKAPPIEKVVGVGVLALALSPGTDNRRLALAGRDKTIRLWEVGSWREVLAIPTGAGLRPSLAFSPDGNELAVATVQGVLRLNAAK